MNAKERRELRRLEIRVEELTKRLCHTQGVADRLLIERVDMTIALRSVGELLEEAVAIVNSVGRER